MAALVQARERLLQVDLFSVVHCDDLAGGRHASLQGSGGAAASSERSRPVRAPGVLDRTNRPQ